MHSVASPISLLDKTLGHCGEPALDVVSTLYKRSFAVHLISSIAMYTSGTSFPIVYLRVTTSCEDYCVILQIATIISKILDS